MKTILDEAHELELSALHYDGAKLVAEVGELVVEGGGSTGKVISGERSYSVTFESPLAHALTPEFPSVVAEWVRGQDNGFLRTIDNPALIESMGLQSFGEHTPSGEFASYALITAHEILVVFSNAVPKVTFGRVS